MMRIGLLGTLLVDLSLDELAYAYQQEVDWSQGYRINTDARLLLIGAQRLLVCGLINEAELASCAVVLGCRLGAMDSYEAFENSLLKNQATPLAFAHALPSMPLASVSVRHVIQGITYTLTGGIDVGLKALQQGAAQLVAGHAEMGIVGCWETPSRTALGIGTAPRCRLQLAVLKATDEGRPLSWFASGDVDVSTEADSVAALSRRLTVMLPKGEQSLHDARVSLT